MPTWGPFPCVITTRFPSFMRQVSALRFSGRFHAARQLFPAPRVEEWRFLRVLRRSFSMRYPSTPSVPLPKGHSGLTHPCKFDWTVRDPFKQIEGFSEILANRVCMLLDRLKICSYMPGGAEKRNARVSMIDGMLFAVMSGLTAPFWGAFAVKLGASDYTLALLSSLPALVSLLAQIPPPLSSRSMKQAPAHGAIGRCVKVVLLVVRSTHPSACSGACQGAGFCADVLAHEPTRDYGWRGVDVHDGRYVHPSLRGRFFGERNMMCTLVTLVATCAAGLSLTRFLGRPTTSFCIWFRS